MRICSVSRGGSNWTRMRSGRRYASAPFASGCSKTWPGGGEREFAAHRPFSSTGSGSKGIGGSSRRSFRHDSGPDNTHPTREEALMAACTHLDHVHITELPESVEGCEECLASGGQWLHL